MAVELGDVTRFRSAPELMSHAGVVPSYNSPTRVDSERQLPTDHDYAAVQNRPADSRLINRRVGASSAPWSGRNERTFQVVAPSFHRVDPPAGPPPRPGTSGPARPRSSVLGGAGVGHRALLLAQERSELVREVACVHEGMLSCDLAASPGARRGRETREDDLGVANPTRAAPAAQHELLRRQGSSRVHRAAGGKFVRDGVKRHHWSCVIGQLGEPRLTFHTGRSRQAAALTR
jgi:hypothetical protein